MPSFTVVVSSDTDICFITPGMGLPSGGGGIRRLLADNGNRLGRGFIPGPEAFFPFHARTPLPPGVPHGGPGVRHIDAMGIVKVT
ncbi:hypothetical protein GCM10010232_20880 [Streptomyces amakusaensis]